MAADLHPDAPPMVDQLGDVVGVQFSQEEEVALFIPSSGDVLLCAASQWSHLKGTQLVSPTGSFSAARHSNGADDAAFESDLKSTLSSLGALLA